MLEITDYDGQLTILTLDLTQVLAGSQLNEVLDDGMIAIVRALTMASNDRGRRVAVDVQLSDASDPFGGQTAILQAIRGLVQAYVREMGHRIQPVNVVASSPSQRNDRELTWEFLADVDGTMARGATFDLREVLR